jgi:hypothetical protein
MSGNKTDNGVLEVGTDEIRMSYSEDTPGQYVDAFIKEQEKAFHEQQKKVKKNFSSVFQNPLKGFPYNEEIIVKPLQEETIQELNTKMPEKVQNQILDMMNKLMDLPYGSIAFKKLKKEQEALQKKYSVKREHHQSKDKPHAHSMDEAFSKKQARGKDIAKKMMKSKTMKAFANKVAKMSKVSPSELDKILPDYVSGGDIGALFEANLQEGTWAVPDSYKKLYNLQVGFLANKKAATELNSRKLLVDLYGIFGDDSLYDDVGEYIDTPNPKFDLRELIVKHLKPFGIKINNSYKITHAPEEWIDNLGKSESKIEERLIEGMPRRGRGNIKKPKGKMVSFVMRKENKEKDTVSKENYNNPSFEEFQEASRKMSGSKLTGAEISSYFRKHKVRDKTVRKAVEIALDHGGAMNYAIKQIEKLKRGLSNHKDVEKALEVANFGEHVSEEDVEKFFGFFSEAFTDAQIDKLRKSYATVKGIDPTTGTGKKLLDFMRGRAEDELVALYKGKINFISLLAASNLIARFKYSSADILKLKEEKLKEAPVLPSTQAGQIQGDHSVEDGVKKYEDVINKQIQTGRFSKLHKERQTKIIARKANKYYRVEEHEMGRAGSIHAFIDISNGDIFKPASFKAPAKGARGNVTDQRYIDYVAKYPDSYYGGHLYK